MAVMARERWTDERLDKSFGRIDADLRELRVEMKSGFDQINKRMDQIDKQFEQVNKQFERVDDRFNANQSEMTARFDAVQRNVMTWMVALFSTIVASLAAGFFALVSLT